MDRLLSFSVRHPRTVVALAAALAVAACLFVPRVQLKLDGRSLIPRGHGSMAAADEAAALFGLRDVVVIAVADPERGIYTPETLAAIVRLSAGLAEVEGIVPESVASLATVPRLFIEEDVIDPQPMLARDGGIDAALARRLRRETEALGLDDGVLVGKGGRAAAIYAEVEPAADRALVRERVRELAARVAAGRASVHFGGNALAQAVLGEAAALDLARLVPLVVLVVGTILVLAFRHPAPALVSMAEIGASLAWTIGLMGARGESVFITTLVLPVILIVIGVSDDVYALNHYFAAAQRAPGRPVAEVVREAFGAVTRPITLTGLTTVVGLLSLLLTALEPQRVFGLYGALAVVFSTLLTFTLVPALLVLLDPRVPPLRARAHHYGERAMAGILRWIEAVGPGRVVAVAAVAVVAAALLTFRLDIEDSWVRNLPPSSDIARGDRAINDLLAGTNTVELLLDSGRPDGFLDPAAFAALGAVAEAIAASPHVGAVASVYDDVARVNAALQGLDYRSYRRDLQRGRAALAGPEIEQALLVLASAGRSPMAERLDAGYRRTRLTIFVRRANYSRIARVLATAGRAAGDRFRSGGGLVPFGDGWISFLTVRLLVVGQVRSIAAAVLANLALLVLLLRSPRAALLAMAPVVLSVLAVFGTLAALGVPLGSANSMFAAIALGVGVDYSIHLVASYRQRIRDGRERRAALHSAVIATGPAIATSALAIGAGFAVLAFSEVPPNRELGLLVSYSMTVCAAMTLLLVPALALLRGRTR